MAIRNKPFVGLEGFRLRHTDSHLVFLRTSDNLPRGSTLIQLGTRRTLPGVLIVCSTFLNQRFGRGSVERNHNPVCIIHNRSMPNVSGNRQPPFVYRLVEAA